MPRLRSAGSAQATAAAQFDIVRSGLGLTNLRDRLAQRYGDRATPAAARGARLTTGR